MRYVSAAAQQRESSAATTPEWSCSVAIRRSRCRLPNILGKSPTWNRGATRSSTNLESALRLAEATLPTDSGRRVVIVSDGNENIGQAMPQTKKMLGAGIGFDCVPISYERHGEIAVEKVVVPTDIRRGTPFTVSVVLNNLSDHAVPGKLRVTRELSGESQIVTDESVTLPPGKRVFTLRQELADSGMSTYDARFVVDHPNDDAHSENNAATAFCQVIGNGRVLLIEDAEQVGKFDSFVSLSASK